MSTNSSNPSERPKQKSAYRPITLEDLQKSIHKSPQDLFAGLTQPVSRWAAIPIFGFFFFYVQKMPVLAPLMILVLLSCLLSGMESASRRIAGVPLALSAIKLSFQMVAETAYPFWTPGAEYRTNDGCFLWLPIFFSACLVFIPKRESATFKIVLAAACVLLASGLLPGHGFVVIFYMLDYMLFVAIIVGILIDLRTEFAGRAHAEPAAAH